MVARRATLKRFRTPQRNRMKPLASALGVALVILACLGCSSARQDPATGKVRLLYIGDYVGANTPARYLDEEPLISVKGVPATLAWYQETFIRKFMRIYMPRTYEDLSGNNDVILFSDAGVRFFESRHFTWFKDAVINDGLGLAMVGGVESFGAEPGRPPWIGTTVADILPVEGVFQSFNPATGTVAILKPENEFIASLPWDTLVAPTNTFLRFNDLNLKEGADELAALMVGKESHLFLVTWMQGTGRTFAMSADWTPTGGVNFMKWEYYGDYASNLVLYTAQTKVPSEHELRHVYKTLAMKYRDGKVLLMATLDFVEKFNANTRSLSLDINANEAKKKEAEKLYIEQDFETAVSRMNEVIQRNEELTKDSLKLRDRALLWVYVIEYLVVIATCLITGTVLYTLMVRRRLYREVEMTRGKGRRL